ncbi:phosphatidylethanolamine N-methyltransferase [Nitrosospira multiformis]|jgi:ubiquinone/menaquinone biosynthesis C-methylase UbiE|uniref:Phosphatidylethanolamine N-methyltransferase n=1 Tax=Nitrosospira multiformis TaxID=1231 RepID=A0A2T5II54_9PROT|nr:methyltransferase domain-containing protein [Nitrosospira multiformis]PTQ83506.1 phosphatidylethanolamine N-methyltransferase [Nitrosospira multiformis]
MSLRRSYSLIAPLYDALLAGAGTGLRAASLEQLPRQENLDILISGIGTGLDLPHVPACHHYVGLDLTAAMLKRARPRIGKLHVDLVQGDSMSLPFVDACFDHVVLHLILAIVPDARACLKETARVLKPGGSVLILDKFLKPGENAVLRRAVNLLSQHIVTRLDVVFEEVLASAPQLKVESDQPLLAGGWFRSIRLIKAS